MNDNNGWISAKKRKPPYCEDVAVLVEWRIHGGGNEEPKSDELQLCSGYVSFRDRWLLNIPSKNGSMTTMVADWHRVIFWMPLPQPPKTSDE